MPPETLADAQDPAAYGALLDCLHCAGVLLALAVGLRLAAMLWRRR